MNSPIQTTEDIISGKNTLPGKKPLGKFLACNPFPNPLTLGFFYREKMRAIYTISPNISFESILEVGGGQGGLTALLYPNANITNLDLDPKFAQAACNQAPNVKFVCGDATQLPFADESFDAVTMFDVLEHIPNDGEAIAEAFRVLKPGGYLLVSTPDQSTWRFPYYSIFKPICPLEAEVMAEWGHVRRGYTLENLKMLMPVPCQQYATFINAITVINHDIAFSKLPFTLRFVLLLAISPITWIAYWLHRPTKSGTETASCWQK
ncbi:class I SAM-dependent methyltransferase [Nodosilinea sp. E11]|uniref:class I SAM-dependent methyltransferase n=1 Tax=Nodosilinea sp. E11 TaxID=3037479 RepID=UPI002934E027|nr:methyltransferase domain-containing protein [Nodosilinea sp. E11]WOD39248.1 methyltransferase domain-containing protein [Nodosilinea sp. E11]